MADLLGVRLLCVLVVLGREDLRDRLDRQIATLHQPLVVLFAQQRAGEPDHGGVVGEDPDDIGASADLLVDPLERVGGAEGSVTRSV